MAQISPMIQQYLEIKSQHQDHILFFRLGDFYEMFFDDAILASRELDLTLTGKDCGLDERAPMCGIPHHASETYIARLIAKGYKVAICEQMEEPGTSKGPVLREVIRVITPGTVIEGAMLDDEKNNYICIADLIGDSVGICFADISTGSIEICESKTKTPSRKIMDDLSRFNPREILLSQKLSRMTDLGYFISNNMKSTVDVYTSEEKETENIFLKEALPIGIYNELFADDHAYNGPVARLLRYIKENKMEKLEPTLKFSVYSDSEYMVLDVSARKNLELTETMRGGEKKGSLLWVLDKTKTAMGKRMIRSYLDQPLCSHVKIQHRLNAVEELMNDDMNLNRVIECLSSVHDLERLITRIVYGSASPRELLALAAATQVLPELKNLISNYKTNLLVNIHSEIDVLSDVCQMITESINENAPIIVSDGNVVATGYNKELDELRRILSGDKGILSDIEQEEKEKTGIKTLKVGYNRVFGYYIEVSKSFIGQVPETYIRKQTLANAERYITPKLKELEAKVLVAQDQIIKIEHELFAEIRAKVASKAERISKTANAVATIDVLCSFAYVSRRNRYIKPEIITDGSFYIKDGRHPVVEQMLISSPFVPNDTLLDCDSNMIAVITGPNMAGKSTYMRQVAVISLMMQIGCFVPAKEARLSVVDRIFTRVGASDDLSAGQSTFMVEMSEVATILKNATKNSLIILDEIGRGTSTFDGMSIAKSVLEFIADKKKIGAKTLFATHYHELTSMENQLNSVKNYNISTKKRGDDLIFLRRIIRGGADDSYGIEVAKLAGIPNIVINRAKEILHQLESEKPYEVINNIDDDVDQTSFSFDSQAENEAIEKLKKIDVTTLTPIESMNILYDIISNLQKN